MVSRRHETLIEKTAAIFHVLLRVVPARDCYRVTGDLSRGSKLPYAGLDSSRWLKFFQENILEVGQYFCRTAPSELLQGRYDK